MEFTSLCLAARCCTVVVSFGGISCSFDISFHTAKLKIDRKSAERQLTCLGKVGVKRRHLFFLLFCYENFETSQPSKCPFKDFCEANCEEISVWLESLACFFLGCLSLVSPIFFVVLVQKCSHLSLYKTLRKTWNFFQITVFLKRHKTFSSSSSILLYDRNDKSQTKK